MNRYLNLVFSVISFIFFLLLVFLREEFPVYPLLNYQDVFDLLFPLVVLPFYWLMFKSASDQGLKLSEEIIFVILAGIWAEGHGMHLAANAINNLLGSLAERGVIDVTSTDIYLLTDFFDEHLSHILWHLGVVGLAALIIYREWRHPAAAQMAYWVQIAAGILYGLTLFCIFLEGGTVWIGLPVTVFLILLVLLGGRRKLNNHPMLTFFFAAGVFAFLLFAGWGIYWGGFPQFSEVGLI